MENITLTMMWILVVIISFNVALSMFKDYGKAWKQGQLNRLLAKNLMSDADFKTLQFIRNSCTA